MSMLMAVDSLCDDTARQGDSHRVRPATAGRVDGRGLGSIVDYIMMMIGSGSPAVDRLVFLYNSVSVDSRAVPGPNPSNDIKSKNEEIVVAYLARRRLHTLFHPNNCLDCSSEETPHTHATHSPGLDGMGDGEREPHHQIPRRDASMAIKKQQARWP